MSGVAKMMPNADFTSSCQSFHRNTTFNQLGSHHCWRNSNSRSYFPPCLFHAYNRPLCPQISRRSVSGSCVVSLQSSFSSITACTKFWSLVNLGSDRSLVVHTNHAVFPSDRQSQHNFWGSSVNLTCCCSINPTKRLPIELPRKPKVEAVLQEFLPRIGRSWTWVTTNLVKQIAEKMRRIRIPVLDRYMMTEMMPVFVMAVGLCSIVGMTLGALAGLVREVVVSGLPIAVAATAALLQLPYFAALSMPMACLAASLFGLGRLQADMETVAIFSAGVSLWRMLVSPLCLGFVAVLLKLVCHECLIPYGSSQARRMVDMALTTHMQGLRQNNDLVYPEYGVKREVGDDGKTIGRSHTVLQRIWYATEMKGTQLSGLLLLDIASSGHIHRVIVADEGEWKFEEGIWKFVNSTILNVCPKDTTFGILQVEGLQVPSARLTSRRALQKPSLQELSRGGILHLIAELRTKLHTKNRNKGESQFSFNLTEAGIGDTSHIHCQEGGEKKEIVTSSARDSKSHNVNRSDEDELVKLECFLHQRDAAIFSCIVYCLVSLIQNPQSDQLMVVPSADIAVAAVCSTLCMGAMATLVQGSRPASSGSRASPITWALLSSMIYNMIVATAAFGGMSRHLTPWLSAWIPPLIGLSLSFFLPVIL